MPTDRFIRVHEAAEVLGGGNRRIRQGVLAHSALRQFRPTPFPFLGCDEVTAKKTVAIGGVDAKKFSQPTKSFGEEIASREW
ncbi:MAG: hypothetical protein IKN27_04445 [Selenomonadaceae bacterium]|nr:hypothetical protein [Selenomonadaceae bacterium]